MIIAHSDAWSHPSAELRTNSSKVKEPFAYFDMDSKLDVLPLDLSRNIAEIHIDAVKSKHWR